MNGPFKILSTGRNDRYCKLESPTTWKIHLTFNIALLQRYRGKSPERELIEIEADDTGWKMEKIIASGPSHNDASEHVYLVKWEGYWNEENTWETFENVNENARELLEESYAENENMDKHKRFGKEEPRKKDAKGTGKRKSCKHRKA